MFKVTDPFIFDDKEESTPVDDAALRDAQAEVERLNQEIVSLKATLQASVNLSTEFSSQLKDRQKTVDRLIELNAYREPNYTVTATVERDRQGRMTGLVIDRIPENVKIN